MPVPSSSEKLNLSSQGKTTVGVILWSPRGNDRELMSVLLLPNGTPGSREGLPSLFQISDRAFEALVAL